MLPRNDSTLVDRGGAPGHQDNWDGLRQWYAMRMRIQLVACVVALTSVAGAEVEPTSKWVRYENKKLGVAVRHPAAAKVAVKGSELTISGPELTTVTITIETTTERNTNKTGGQTQLHVDWTIEVPKRRAHCEADADDLDKAVHASTMCDTIELTPGPRDPHIELVVASTGLVDGDAYDKAVHTKQKALDACWKAALAKDSALPEGALSVKRTYESGQASGTNEHAENFFDHDTKALGKCIFGLVEGVAVKTAEPAASIELTMVCRLY